MRPPDPGRAAGPEGETGPDGRDLLGARRSETTAHDPAICATCTPRLGPVNRRLSSEVLRARAASSPRRSPLAGLEPVGCACAECRLNRSADKAIATDGVVPVEGSDSLVIAADTVVAEAEANGAETPNTYRMTRGDGRSAYLFKRPA